MNFDTGSTQNIIESLISSAVAFTNLVGCSPYERWVNFKSSFTGLREAPTNKIPKAFGHCPFSYCIPPPALKRALWDTSFWKKVPQTIRSRV